MQSPPENPGAIPTVTDIAATMTGRAERLAAAAADLTAATTHQERFVALAKSRQVMVECHDASLTDAALARMAEEFPLAKLTSEDASLIANQAGAGVTSSHLRQGTGHLSGRLGANKGLLLQIRARLNKEFLSEQLNAGRSYTAIAEEVGVHPVTVAKHARKHGLSRQPTARRTS